MLLGTETWFYRHTSEFVLLLTAAVLWFVTTLSTSFLLVPLNHSVMAGSAGWQQAHRSWDSRHRVRVGALAIAAILLTSSVVR